MYSNFQQLKFVFCSIEFEILKGLTVKKKYICNLHWGADNSTCHSKYIYTAQQITIKEAGQSTIHESPNNALLTLDIGTELER